MEYLVSRILYLYLIHTLSLITRHSSSCLGFKFGSRSVSFGKGVSVSGWVSVSLYGEENQLHDTTGILGRTRWRRREELSGLEQERGAHNGIFNLLYLTYLYSWGAAAAAVAAVAAEEVGGAAVVYSHNSSRSSSEKQQQ